MRRWILGLALLCAGAGLVIYFASKPSPALVSPKPTSAVTKASSPAPARQQLPVTESSETGSTSAPAGTAPGPDIASQTPAGQQTPGNQTAIEAGENTSPNTTFPPATLVENVRLTIRAYGLRFGGNPVGSNAEITQALNGSNPKQVVFIQAEQGLRMNGQGELIDSWGTPFFFHQLSSTQTEVRSAGPDKKMYTRDDLVVK